MAASPDPFLGPHWTEPSSFKRIRIVERDDIEATYPLLAAYVQDPAMASSISEMVVDPDGWPSSWSGGCSLSGKPPNSELDEPPKPVSEDAHAAMEGYVRGLGLGNATTDAMIGALRWKKDHLLGRRPEITHDNFRGHNQEYAGTATVLLLSLATNLETLHMGAMDGGGYGAHALHDYLLHNNHGRLPKLSLQKLKTLHYIAIDPRGHYKYKDERSYDELDFFTQLRCFHRLPALETVTMDAVMSYQRVTHEVYPPGTGSFKRLNMTHVDIGSGVLSAMIRLPRDLEELTLSVGGLWQTDGGFPHVAYKTLGKALRDHKTTLQTLDFDLGDLGRSNTPEEENTFDDDQGYEGDDEWLIDEWYRIDLADSNGPLYTHQLPVDGNERFGMGIGSLKDFTALRRLSIDPHALLGWNRQVYKHDPELGSYYQDFFDPPFRLIDGLPKGLEVLRLYGYAPRRDATVDGHIRELMRLKGEKLPNLKVVEGVEETIEVMGDRSSDRGEDELWQRPEKEVHWVHVRDEL